MGQITAEDVVNRGGKPDRAPTRLELSLNSSKRVVEDVLRSWWAPAALAVGFSFLGVRLEYALGAVVIVLAPQVLTAIRLARGESKPRQGSR